MQRLRRPPPDFRATTRRREEFEEALIRKSGPPPLKAEGAVSEITERKTTRRFVTAPTVRVVVYGKAIRTGQQSSVQGWPDYSHVVWDGVVTVAARPIRIPAHGQTAVRSAKTSVPTRRSRSTDVAVYADGLRRGHRMPRRAGQEPVARAVRTNWGFSAAVGNLSRPGRRRPRLPRHLGGPDPGDHPNRSSSAVSSGPTVRVSA